MDVVQEGHAGRLDDGETGQLLPRRIEQLPASGGVGAEDHLAQVVHQRAVARLTPTKRGFGIPPTPDLGHDAEHADRLARLVGDHGDAVGHPYPGTVAAPEAILLFPAPVSLADRVLNPRDDALTILRVDTLVPPRGRDLPGGALVEHPFEPLAPDDPVAQQVPIPHHAVGGARREAVALFALLDLRLHPLPLVDVLKRYDPVAEVLVSIGDRGDRRQHPDRLTRSPDAALLAGVGGTLAGTEQALGLALAGPIVGVGVRLGEIPDQIRGGGAEQLGQRVVHSQPAPVGRHDAQGEPGLAEQVARRQRRRPCRLEAAQLDLGHGGSREVLEQRLVALGPETRHDVHDSESPDDMPLSGHQGDAGIGDPAQLADGWSRPEQRVAAGVVHHEGPPGVHHVAAERGGGRGVPPARPRLGQPGGALEELAILGEEGDEGDRGAQEPGGHPGQPVEGLFRRGVEQRRAPDSGKPLRCIGLHRCLVHPDDPRHFRF